MEFPLKMKSELKKLRSKYKKRKSLEKEKRISMCEACVKAIKFGRISCLDCQDFYSQGGYYLDRIIVTEPKLNKCKDCKILTVNRNYCNFHWNEKVNECSAD